MRSEEPKLLQDANPLLAHFPREPGIMPTETTPTEFTPTEFTPEQADTDPNGRPRILLVGSTGYVGRRLLGLLERKGYRVRCLARRPEFLQPTVSADTEVVRGDLLDPDSLNRACRDIDVAYYLAHALGSSGDFEAEESRGAQNFAAAASACGVRRIIYLGGLGPDTPNLSPHLRSRQRVGRILRDSGASVLEFRASIVVGSGSVSFEVVRALVERLPVMITPRWVSVPAQPIAIDDLLAYLEAALSPHCQESRIVEIGGADVVSYGGLMHEYARQRGLRRWMIRVPALTPRLSSLWLGLVTPVYARIGRRLVDSLRHASVVEDPQSAQGFNVRPRGVADAIAGALRNEDREFVETRWSDALSSSGGSPRGAAARFGARHVDTRTIAVAAPPEAAFAVVQRIGGSTGWYFANYLWKTRGMLDRLVGGVGLGRGRRHPERLAPGDTLDWWRVEVLESGQRLRLAAEMKLPGRAWLEFEVNPAVGGGAVVRQTAEFDPVGICGRLYWYGLWPAHAFIFRGMLRGIAKAAIADGAKQPL